MAVTLQRSLLPRGLPEQNALEVAYRYLPGPGRGWAATGSTSSRCPAPGSRWSSATSSATACTPPPPWAGCAPPCTTSPPSTCRPTSCSATSTTWSARIDQDEDADGRAARAVTGATCLYAIYDPVARQLHPGPRRPSAARAGPAPTAPWSSSTCPPARRSAWAACPSRPPSWQLAGGQPAGPLHRRAGRGPRTATSTPASELLRDGPGAGRTGLPEDTCAGRAATRCCPARPERRRRPARRPHPACSTPTGSPPGTCPPTRRPSAEVRAAVARQLADWGLEELAFTTELILSELVTNAIRYGAGPIQRAPAPRPHPDLRGLRRQQHLPAPAPRGHHGRGRPRPVPRRPARRALGHPLHPRAARSSGPNSRRARVERRHSTGPTTPWVSERTPRSARSIGAGRGAHQLRVAPGGHGLGRRLVWDQPP